MSVSISNLVAPSITPSTTWLVGPIASGFKTGETFEVYSLKGLYQVDATGAMTTIPLGASGPFVLKIDNEQILCSAANYDTNHVTVYSSSLGNGRGYASTTIAAHTPGGSTTGQVQLVSTSVQGGVPSAGGTVTLTSGTAVQNTASTWATYYVVITGGTAGTVTVALGSTSAASTVIFPAVANNAVVYSQVIPVRVPSMWYLKVTTSVATINSSTVIINDSL